MAWRRNDGVLPLRGTARGIARGFIRCEAERAIGDSGVQGVAGVAYDESGLIWSLDYLMGQWSPGIDDPTSWAGSRRSIAWSVLLLCRCSSPPSLNQMEEKRDCLFWMMIMVLMLFFSVSKQLDLQSLFAEGGGR